MSSSVEQIKDRLSVLDVLSVYIKVEKSGKNYKAKCPFHNEKTASFFISPERNTYYCFGCGAKGDIFSFVEAFEGLDFMGALKMLAERAGVPLDTSRLGKSDPHARLYAIVTGARDFFVEELRKNEKAREYLASRDIAVNTIDTFSLGYAKAEWRGLFDYLSGKGFSTAEMLTAGLVKQKDDEAGKGIGSQPYDVFRDRVIFPIFDTSGRCVAFSGRVMLAHDEYAPKYINSPETPIFKKSETLYGFEKAKTSIRTYDFSILVEGPIDLLMAHQAGFTNAVASMGTAITTYHIERLKRLSGNIVIALDGDDAGVASALKTARIAMSAGMDVKVALMPEGKDPADLIREDKEKWREAVRSAEHVIEFLLNRILGEESDDRKSKKRIEREVLPYVALITSKIDQRHFIQLIATRLLMEESVILEEIEKLPFALPERESGRETPKIENTKHDRLTRFLHGILFWQEKNETKEIDVEILRETLKRILKVNAEELYKLDERDTVAFEAEVAYGGSTHMKELVGEMITFLEEHALKEELLVAMTALRKAEGEGKQEEALRLLTTCKEITERLNKLRTTVN